MTPKEKAREIYERMEVDVNDYSSNYPTYSPMQAKECALVCVDEIMKAIDWNDIEPENKDDFWDDVKTELEKLR